MIEGIVLAVAGVAVLASGLAAASGRLRRNAFVGIRTRTSMSSDEAWDIVHRAGGPWLTAGGLALLIGGAVTAAAGSGTVRMTATLAGAVLCVLLALVAVYIGHTAYRDRVR
ncbi:SdpI family protein [Actinomadura harenae]|uniref:SdpI family protein n=1 Tax=Actinomadura harenae TaxID=2483351 RepID=A0A3M2LWA5_9ACTN|nr:SdpI family protein [Actinomadura harenae]RMI40833.1 SdpI family protein [Actinomadura harenae]